jgi:hypothetical protein
MVTFGFAFSNAEVASVEFGAQDHADTVLFA